MSISSHNKANSPETHLPLHAFSSGSGVVVEVVLTTFFEGFGFGLLPLGGSDVGIRSLYLSLSPLEPLLYAVGTIISSAEYSESLVTQHFLPEPQPLGLL